jgi:hypothetical protein
VLLTIYAERFFITSARPMAITATTISTMVSVFIVLSFRKNLSFVYYTYFVFLIRFSAVLILVRLFLAEHISQ